MMSFEPRFPHPSSIRIAEKHSRAHRHTEDHRSSSDSNIRSWLEQIVDPSHPPPQTVELYDVETGNGHSSWHPYGLAGVQLGNKDKPSVCKRHHLSSRSSSPVGKERHQNDDGRFPPHRGKHNRSAQQTDKVRENQEDDGLSTRSESSVSVFEKRPRRKTRQNRYETRKEGGEPSQKPQPKKHKSRASKHKDRPITSRLDVMNNFASDAIPQTRLSMKPKLTTGLFINGRTSKTESLTDLAFNDMVFLSRHDKDEMIKESIETMNPKSHHLDPKRPDEDADFFNLVNGHGKIPHKGESTKTLSRHGFTSGQKTSEKSEEKSRSGGSVQLSHKHQETDDPASLSENDDERVTRETTYISWSTSNRGETPHKLAVESRRAHSRTPESIRAALEKTGVFDGIGRQARETSLDPKNLQQEATVDVPGTQSLTRNQKEAIAETPRYEDKGVMVSPRARGKSPESHIGLQNQEPDPKMLTEAELGRYEDHVERGESRGAEQPNSLNVNGPSSVDNRQLESYSREEAKAAIPLPWVDIVCQGRAGLPHGIDDSFLVPSASKMNLVHPGTGLHDSFHLSPGHGGLSSYGFETSLPRVQPFSYSFLSPHADQRHCDTQIFDSAEFQGLPSRELVINDRWHTSENSQPDITRWYLPAAQPVEQKLYRIQQDGEDDLHEDLEEQAYDPEETMQEYIERIELEAMLDDEQDLYNPEEIDFIEEEYGGSSEWTKPSTETALRGCGVDEPFLCHPTISELDSPKEFQGTIGRDWSRSNRREWLAQERHQEKLADSYEHMQHDNAELEMTSFWRPNRFM